MISKSQAEAITKQNHLPPRQADALVKDYSDAQIDALKRALLVASSFSLVGLWFARGLPAQALGEPAKGTEPSAAPPAPAPEPLVQA